MNPIVAYIAARMLEPSTWAGLANILIAAKIMPAGNADMAQILSTVGIAVGGVLAAIFPEKSGVAHK